MVDSREKIARILADKRCPQYDALNDECKNDWLSFADEILAALAETTDEEMRKKIYDYLVDKCPFIDKCERQCTPTDAEVCWGEWADQILALIQPVYEARRIKEREEMIKELRKIVDDLTKLENELKSLKSQEVKSEEDEYPNKDARMTHAKTRRMGR